MSAPLPHDQPAPIVLASRSPRRHELLSLLVGKERVLVRPPRDSEEEGFSGVQVTADVARRLSRIARAKYDDVVVQLQGERAVKTVAAIVAADTIILARDDTGALVVLGQPPDDAGWRDVVREWFERFLLGRYHRALTAVCIGAPEGPVRERVVVTEVKFRAAAREWLDWYLQTEEPRGKAGGYGLQGAGSLFVEAIHGSPSNVIGLPLWETAELLRDTGVITARLPVPGKPSGYTDPSA